MTLPLRQTADRHAICTVYTRDVKTVIEHTVKNIRISTYILWRVFVILTQPAPCAFVSVSRPGPHCNENSPQNICRYTDIFTVHSTRVLLNRASPTIIIRFSWGADVSPTHTRMSARMSVSWNAVFMQLYVSAKRTYSHV